MNVVLEAEEKKLLAAFRLITGGCPPTHLLGVCASNIGSIEDFWALEAWAEAHKPFTWNTGSGVVAAAKALMDFWEE